MKKRITAGLLFSAIAVVGCGSPDVAQREPPAETAESSHSDEEMATETLRRMLAVAAKGDWKTYVDDYYGEKEKFRSPADRDALVKRFQEKWGANLVQGLERASRLPLKIDGDKAMFLDDDEPVFVLHRSENGGWKFHL